LYLSYRESGNWGDFTYKNTNTIDLNTWYDVKLTVHGDTFTLYAVNDSISHTSSLHNTNTKVGVWSWDGDTWVDNYRVRKYTDPEPTTTVGNEETNFCISGQVTLSGNPVQGAVVRAICQDDETYAGDTTTDENGNYTITGLAGNKKYHIVVEYTDGSGNKYNAESKWDITPSEGS